MFYFPFSLIKRFSSRRRSLRMLWASNGWRGRLTSPPFHSVCRGASNRKHSFIPPCCRQVLWERTSMIKLKSYLNLWPEHYQGLQEERFNRQREREERAMLALLPIPKIVLEWMLAMWGGNVLYWLKIVPGLTRRKVTHWMEKPTNKQKQLQTEKNESISAELKGICKSDMWTIYWKPLI